MKNFRQLIQKHLRDLSSSARLVNDPNKSIDEVVGENIRLQWYPPYLAKDETTFFLFYPFSFNEFVDKDEVREECKAAETVVNALKEKGVAARVIFIAQAVEDVKILQSLDLAEHFGLFHNEVDPPVLQLSVTAKKHDPQRIMKQPLRYLANSRNLAGPIADALRTFAAGYPKSTQSKAQEYDCAKALMGAVLSCDRRFKLETKAIRFMSRIERTLVENNVNLRDHYFHACNTMLIGFVIIDKLYPQFQSLCRKQGSNIVLEFLWVITSLYHDIGHPASLQPQLIMATYDAADEKGLAETSAKQTRQYYWDQRFTKASEVLENLFSHLRSDSDDAWVYDGFEYECTERGFIDGLRNAFVEDGSHGAQGALILLSRIDRLIKKVKKAQDRQFLYRHIVIAALSMLFHDAKVREVLRAKGITNIRVADVPLGVLLAYVDIIQDDRRDITGIIARPDLFKGINVQENRIVATLNKDAMERSTCKKIHDELREALNFFIMNGLTFLIPAELVAT